MNFLLTLAYDGTNYCGFQVQPNGRSVAATFQDALEAVLGSRPDIKGCSRTDAGVHALGFRLNFHADTRIPPQLYVAVAELLAWLYRVEQDAAPAAAPPQPQNLPASLRPQPETP